MMVCLSICIGRSSLIGVIGIGRRCSRSADREWLTSQRLPGQTAAAKPSSGSNGAAGLALVRGGYQCMTVAMDPSAPMPAARVVAPAAVDRCLIRCNAAEAQARFEAVLLERGGGRRLIGISPAFAAAEDRDLTSLEAEAALETLLVRLRNEGWRIVPNHRAWFGADAPGAPRHWFELRLERREEESRQGILSRLAWRRRRGERLAVALARRARGEPAAGGRRSASA